MENPLHHFELHPIWSWHPFGIDLSINIAVIMMWFVVAAVSLFFILGGRKRQLVPSKFQSVVEVAVLFLRQTVLETMGPQGLVFLPLLVTLFFFILFSNLLGLIPGSYTATSQVMVTGVFALAVFVLSLTVGFWYHGFGYVKAFVPSGIPRPRRRGLLGVLFFIGYMLFMVFMVVIEIISVVARPITLAVRLFANMTAGHMVILIFLGLMFMGGLWVGWLPFAMTVPIYLLEVFVAFMQAYVFVMLTCVFVGMAMHPH